MNHEISLASTLSSLKFIASSPLLKTSLNSPLLTKCVKEFKNKLIKSLDSTQFSDIFLKNVADCLYDLKSCDRNTSYHLSKTFESRPSIITNQLKGGVLWVYFNNPSLNRHRRKVINSSCRVAITQSIREFLDLKENVTNICRFNRILRNLKVVGDCYKVPISPKTRLEQSILESSEIFKLSFECYQILPQMCNALQSLRIDNEDIAKVILEIFCEYLQKDDQCTQSDISSITRTFYKWRICRSDSNVSFIQILKEYLESGKFYFTRNVSSTVKLFTAAVRLPKSQISCDLCSFLMSQIDSIVNFCNNSDLILLINSVSHFKRLYPESDIVPLDNLISNLSTFVNFENSGLNENFKTIHRSCKILNKFIGLNELIRTTESVMAVGQNNLNTT